MVLGLRSLKGIKSALGGVKGDSFSDEMVITDFMSADFSGLAVGTEHVIGEYTVIPQEERAMGFGTPEHQANQGTLFLTLKDNAGTPVVLDGEIRIVKTDYAGLNGKVVFKQQLSNTRMGETDITKRIKFPLRDLWAQQNDKYKLIFIPATIGSGTLSKTNSIAYISTTVRNVSVH